jgi:xylulose-5-phosphate/fructose-6-phosphate phosphoketolase
VDLMTLQPKSEHPHGLGDKDFDALFTPDKPVIFAFHGYPWLIHRFHLVGDVVDRVPRLGGRAAYVKQLIRDKLIDHKRYVHQRGEDMAEIREWQSNGGRPAASKLPVRRRRAPGWRR